MIHIESAGTGSWNVGNAPNPPLVRGGRPARHPMAGVARQFHVDDFGHLDLVHAMDHDNAAHLRPWRPDGRGPREGAPVALLRHVAGDDDDRAVPDPYYGGPTGSSMSSTWSRSACAGLLVQPHGAGAAP